jgi:hypothetical protein
MDSQTAESSEVVLQNTLTNHSAGRQACRKCRNSFHILKFLNLVVTTQYAH